MKETRENVDEAGRLLGLIPHGLYLVGVDTGRERFVYTASWLTQVSFKPRFVATAVRRDHRGHRLIREAGTFAVSFLAEDQEELAELGFSTEGDRLERLHWHICPMTGAVVVDGTLGYLGCRVRRWIAGGDHDLVLAEVVAAETFREGPMLTLDRTPWTYSG